MAEKDSNLGLSDGLSGRHESDLESLYHFHRFSFATDYALLKVALLRALRDQPYAFQLYDFKELCDLCVVSFLNSNMVEKFIISLRCEEVFIEYPF